MFQVIEKLGVPTSFIHIIRLLFHAAVVSIIINNYITKPFEFRRVRHGCMLVLYLFIIVMEAFNIAIKNVVRIGSIKGISLPQCHFQQIINQYAYDTSLTVRAEEASVENLVGILHNFIDVSRLEIN